MLVPEDSEYKPQSVLRKIFFIIIQNILSDRGHQTKGDV